MFKSGGISSGIANFSRGILRHVTNFDQSQTSENISDFHKQYFSVIMSYALQSGSNHTNECYWAAVFYFSTERYALHNVVLIFSLDSILKCSHESYWAALPWTCATMTVNQRETQEFLVLSLATVGSGAICDQVLFSKLLPFLIVWTVSLRNKKARNLERELGPRQVCFAPPSDSFSL